MGEVGRGKPGRAGRKGEVGGAGVHHCFPPSERPLCCRPSPVPRAEAGLLCVWTALGALTEAGLGLVATYSCIRNKLCHVTNVEPQQDWSGVVP